MNCNYVVWEVVERIEHTDENGRSTGTTTRERARPCSRRGVEAVERAEGLFCAQHAKKMRRNVYDHHQLWSDLR